MRYTWIALTSALALSACAHPLVKYDVARPGTEDFRFQLAESIIKFDIPKDPNGGYNPPLPRNVQLTITSVPIPFEDRTYTITGTDEIQNWGVKTDIQATHRQDTQLLQEVGSQVTDSRKDIISGVASTIAAGAAFFASSNPPEVQAQTYKISAPTGLSVSKLLADPQCSSQRQSGDPPTMNLQGCTLKQMTLDGGGYDDGNGNSNFVADITIGSLSSNAEPLPAAVPSKADALFYSACRTLNIHVTNPKISGFANDATLRVADPQWIEWVRIPAKGKVILGATCGADVTSEDAALPTAMDYINASISAAKSIKDTLAGKSGATGGNGGGAANGALR
ncbi:MAG TPA: hypothetical protein VLC74_10120 [Rhizomicrobium sp.]|nr:hypothetical protein [Rhizomicrobium sp.]